MRICRVFAYVLTMSSARIKDLENWSRITHQVFLPLSLYPIGVKNEEDTSQWLAGEVNKLTRCCSVL